MWRHIKHEEMPVRTHTSVDELKMAVDTALDKRAAALCVAVTPVDHSMIYLPDAA